SEFGASGFSAFPGGDRNYGGSYDDVGINGYFWSSSEYNSFYGWTRKLFCDNSDVYRNYGGKHYGFSVRCLGD
ncbi:MAG: hypothetical protein H8E72_09455, partial [Candidatus Marinimicrobia bacterium]|nr:hypothetical protein [Candidatus Neomarinimicrobiota bacterium]